MIDAGVPPVRDDWPGGVLERLREWEQGDLVKDPPFFFYFADPAIPVWEGTKAYSAGSAGAEVVLGPESFHPPYGLVTSQTCDIGEEDSANPIRPWVQIAPVYEVTDGGWKKKLRRGGGPRYWLYVPDMNGDAVLAADSPDRVPRREGMVGATGAIRRISGLGSPLKGGSAVVLAPRSPRLRTRLQ